MLKTLVKRLVSAMVSSGEQKKAQLDDYVLEHFLLYHGLVGSSPENQRSFKDVRADIISAIERRSTTGLAITLKLAPLWWDDKLKTIFSELKDKHEKLIVELLLPEEANEVLPANANPLLHEDWRVRANAASILAFYNAQQATARIVQAIDDTTDNTKPAFCHLAYALGRLKNTEARSALEQRLNDEEPWFRVDAAGALALSEYSQIAKPLMESMLSYHPLSDYCAVVIGQKHKPLEFLKSEDALIVDGACQMIVGTIEAASGTFSNDTAMDAELWKCLTPLKEKIAQDSNAIRIKAAYSLLSWMRAQHDALSELHADVAPIEIDKEQDKLKTESVKRAFTRTISTRQGSYSERELIERRRAIELIGELKIEEAAPEIISFLKDKEPLLDAAVDAAGKLGSAEAAAPLVKLIRAHVNLKDRCERSPSKQPVQEDDPALAKTYWLALRAMASMHSPDAVSLLYEATGDFAPDKREQALLSLGQVLAGFEPGKSKLGNEEITLALKKGLHDPSTQVKVAALKGIARLSRIELLEDLLPLCDGQEVSLSRQAFHTLQELWEKGHGQKVQERLKSKLASDPDHNKKHRIETFLTGKAV